MVPGSPMYAYANCNTGSWRVLKWLEPATLPFVRSAAVVAGVSDAGNLGTCTYLIWGRMRLC